MDRALDFYSNGWRFESVQGSMDIRSVEVESVTEKPDRYEYHGKDLDIRQKINHGRGQRSVINLPDSTWPTDSPEDCIDDSSSGTWYKALDTGKEYLLCRGCGLDCT